MNLRKVAIFGGGRRGVAASQPPPCLLPASDRWEFIGRLAAIGLRVAPWCKLTHGPDHHASEGWPGRGRGIGFCEQHARVRTHGGGQRAVRLEEYNKNVEIKVSMFGKTCFCVWQEFWALQILIKPEERIPGPLGSLGALKPWERCWPLAQAQGSLNHATPLSCALRMKPEAKPPPDGLGWRARVRTGRSDCGGGSTRCTSR